MMDTKENFSVRSRVKSFGYAFSGLYRFFGAEHNAWIHVAAVAVVVTAGFSFHLTKYDWIGVVFAIGLVLSAEAFNTCIEKAMDMLAPQRDARVKYIKDLAAGAVLIAAATALIIGMLVFLPKFM